MLYLLETNLPDQKSVLFSLMKVHGLGKNTTLLICKKMGFSVNFKVKNLNQEQIVELLELINSLNLSLNTELKKLESIILRKFVNIKSYRGLRRIKGLPVRGQRTHTNAKSAKKNNRRFF
jgi:small subunit ribosomal protein S13